MRIIFIILINIFFLSCSDVQQNYYINKNDVVKDSAIQRGWIPAIIPNSAYEIEEKHNLDTNEIKGSFKYSEKDENNFINILTKSNGKLIWENFEFLIDRKNNKVKFKNKPKV